jgi:hypothetical protein
MFEEAQKKPELLQVLVNTVLGERGRCKAMRRNGNGYTIGARTAESGQCQRAGGSLLRAWMSRK